MASTAAAPSQTLTLDAAPAAGQLIEHEGKIYTTVKEGRAYILVPPNARTSVDPNEKARNNGDGSHVQSVFYNPIQQFNRDLSVLAIKAFGRDVCRRKRERRTLVKEKERRKVERKIQAGQGLKRKRDQNDGERQVPQVKDQQNGDLPSGVASGEGQSGVEKLSTEEAEDEPATSRSVPEGDEGDTGADQTQVNGEAAPTSQPRHINEKDPPAWKPRFRILDALSATGLRALRYASEISTATKVVANDREKQAVESIKINAEHNKLSSYIDTHTGDANGHMYRIAFPPEDSHGPHHQNMRYDVIDLDPYGTAAPFIDSALQALEDGGLLCVTCTDSGVWASCGYSEKTYSLYGGLPIKGNHSHEGGLRLILHSVASSAAKYGLAIEPLLSLSIDFYLRVFIRVRKSANEVKFLAGKSMLVYGCDAGCGAWKTQFIGRHQLYSNSTTNWKFGISQAPTADSACEHCGSRTHIAGPMWGGPIHNPAFIEKILDDVQNADGDVYQTKSRIEGMLNTALEELSVSPEMLSLEPSKSAPSNNTNGQEQRDAEMKKSEDSISLEILPKLPPQLIDHHPFYFIPSSLCKVIKSNAPRDEQIKGALRHAGYRAARTHCKPGAIKTDAPWSVIWEVMREWARQKSPVKEGALKQGTAGWKIMQRAWKADPSTDVAEGVVNGESGQNGDGDSPKIVTEATEAVGANVKSPLSSLQSMKVVFDESLGKDNKQGKRLVRYQQNPRENWGPMAKARGSG